jgi:hypothetical protein
MLLGGLWHGAGWTFVAWGGLHGLYLVVNHAWRELKARLGWGEGGRAARLAAAALTFFAVVIGWVLFRAESFPSAWAMLWAMAGGNGMSLPVALEPHLAVLTAGIPAVTLVFDGVAPVTGMLSGRAILGVASGLALVWFFPNVRQIMSGFRPVWEDLAAPPATRPSMTRAEAPAAAWRLSLRHAVATGVLLFLALLLISDRRSEFLYFQF